jgi:hypothetical protein
MSPVTTALIEYWHRLPVESVPARRRRVEALAAAVQSGASPPSALVACALGDPEASVVVEAVSGYVEASGSPAARRAALDDACEWIRRDLALNRGAVFAALLRSGAAEVYGKLAPHRLALGTTDVETVCRLLAGSAVPRRTRRYLYEWLGLLEATDGPEFARQRTLLRGLVDARSERPRAVA